MPESIRHGHSGYTHGGCRCDVCKTAMSEYKREWRRRNSDREKAKDRAYYAAHREESRAYRTAPERKKAAATSARIRYAKSADAIRARVSAYQASKPPARTLSRAKRRAILRDTDRREVTDRDWRRLCARYRNRCAYCESDAPLTMDHVIPLVRGGRHAIGNLIPACGSCNSSKNSRLLIEWAGRPNGKEVSTCQ